VFVATSIGVTEPPKIMLLTTYAVLPSGVIAIPPGEPLSGIGVPAVFVATLIGVTELAA
jgi:hypothetical protein